jgi:hypothetical protein
MEDFGTKLGGSPTEWHDAASMGEHLRTLVKHGNDPTRHLDRFRELISKTPDGDPRRNCEEFLKLIEGYVAAIGRGSVHCEDWKHQIERLNLPRLGDEQPTAVPQRGTGGAMWDL